MLFYLFVLLAFALAACPTSSPIIVLEGVYGVKCGDTGGISPTVRYDHCYQLSFTCATPCDVSCCEGADFEDCMACTGCDAQIDGSFKIVNGTLRVYYDNSACTPGGDVASAQAPNTCGFGTVNICGYNYPNFNQAALDSKCVEEPAASTTTSGSSSTGEGSTTTSTIGSPGGEARSVSSSAGAKASVF